MPLESLLQPWNHPCERLGPPRRAEARLTKYSPYMVLWTGGIRLERLTIQVCRHWISLPYKVLQRVIQHWYPLQLHYLYNLGFKQSKSVGKHGNAAVQHLVVVGQKKVFGLAVNVEASPNVGCFILDSGLISNKTYVACIFSVRSVFVAWKRR